MPGPLTLTMKELDRLQVMTRIAERRLTRRKAAALLGLSERWVRRLYRAFTGAGAAGLADRRRGRPSNRRLAEATRDRALALLRERYADFGPTFAHQKLTEEHAVALSVETLRAWMITAGLWVPRLQRTRRSYPPRPRRACLGELVQIDGSVHAWFEDRGPVCTLLVYVDDATSRLMALSFAAVESTFDLTELFTLQATCRISRQLTVHYKRDLYLLEDAIPNRRLRGATVVVSEAEDGTVTIRANGRVLASRLHPKDHAHLDPGVVVEHKHLDGVFAWIAAHQQERDATRLANPKISGREMHGSSFSGDGARAVRDLSVVFRDLLAG